MFFDPKPEKGGCCEELSGRETRIKWSAFWNGWRWRKQRLSTLGLRVEFDQMRKPSCLSSKELENNELSETIGGDLKSETSYLGTALRHASSAWFPKWGNCEIFLWRVREMVALGKGKPRGKLALQESLWSCLSKACWRWYRNNNLSLLVRKVSQLRVLIRVQYCSPCVDRLSRSLAR